VATREDRGWNRSDLARESGMTPNNFSRLEDPEYGKHTLSSLKRIAAALDVALVVRFVPFSQFIDWISGTPYLDRGIRPEALAVPSFHDEEKSGQYETKVQYAQINVTPRVSAFEYLTTSPIQEDPRLKMLSGLISGSSCVAYQSTVPTTIYDGKAA